jgi:GT2 family glycosyltransferase
MSEQPIASVVIVSYNTRDVLRECLTILAAESKGLDIQTLVVDNTSRDGSADMVANEFPSVEVIRSSVNLGFAAANNVAFPKARGRYVILLNSDALLLQGALQRSIAHMDQDPDVGLGGARLVGRDGLDQPSARLFPSLLNDLLTLSGLAGKYPSSRFFGRFDRTWADPAEACDVDWVPGAFSIIRRDVLEKVGYFDENFFLYYEEVDLCRRFQNQGYRIRYWPDVKVIHLGGESSKTVTTLSFSRSGSQLTLWRMRAGFLYYRKHHGAQAWLAKEVERLWHQIRAWKNKGKGEVAQAKRDDSITVQAMLERAWQETSGGRVSPPRPW